MLLRDVVVKSWIIVSRAKLCLVSVFRDIVKDCHKIRNLRKIFLRSFENVAQALQLDFKSQTTDSNGADYRNIVETYYSCNDWENKSFAAPTRYDAMSYDSRIKLTSHNIIIFSLAVESA